MRMTISEAIYILDPQTTRDALRPYDYDPEGRIRIVEDACRVVCAALRAQQEAEAPLTMDEINKMHFDKIWLSYAGEDAEEGDGEYAVVLYGKIYSIDVLDGSGFEDALNDVANGETLDSPSGKYVAYRRGPEKVLQCIRQGRR